MRHLAMLFLLSLAFSAAGETTTGSEIIERSGTQGGLVVHVGCGNGELTASLRVNDGYLVHGIDMDAVQITEAKRRLSSKGLYGPVSFSLFNGRNLPYIDNLVNLLVAHRPGDVSMDEVMRVLVPGGVAYVDNNKTSSSTGRQP